MELRLPSATLLTTPRTPLLARVRRGSGWLVGGPFRVYSEGWRSAGCVVGLLLACAGVCIVRTGLPACLSAETFHSHTQTCRRSRQHALCEPAAQLLSLALLPPPSAAPRFTPNTCHRKHLPHTASDVREGVADGVIDLKSGARKASIRAESTVEEGKEKGRSWLARLFGRGKVGAGCEGGKGSVERSLLHAGRVSLAA